MNPAPVAPSSRLRRTAGTAAVVVALAAGVVAPAPARAMGDPATAALQVALLARGLYGGDVDGLYGPATAAALAAYGRGVSDPTGGGGDATALAALRGPAYSPPGSRLLAVGCTGWDVAELQFLLAWHGFPSGQLDGRFALETAGALRRFERWARLPVDGVAGPAVLRALAGPPPSAPALLAWPLAAPVGDRFGPRGDRFHAGVDILAATGTPVDAGAAGRVTYAGWRDGGWGYEVTVASGGGVRVIYAHLSRISVAVGDAVGQGEALGAVGATGDATGPHLHLELRLRGAAVDPLSSLPAPAAAADPPGA